jgi:two-component system LytT family response regulator
MKRYPFDDTKMLIINRKTAKKIPIKDILYLRADNNYTYFIMVSGATFLVAHSIKYFADFLASIHFVRVHRRYIINPLYVLELVLEVEQISLSNGDNITISRRYKKVVNQLLGHKKKS